MPETEQIDPAVGFVQRLREFIYGFMEESKEGNPLLSAIWMGIRGEVPNILNTLEQSPDMVRAIQQKMYYVATGEIPAAEEQAISERVEEATRQITEEQREEAEEEPPGDLPIPGASKVRWGFPEEVEAAAAEEAAEVAAADADAAESAEIAQLQADDAAREQAEQPGAVEPELQAEPGQVEEAAHVDQDPEGEAGEPGDRPD